MRSPLHHLVLTVSDIERSKPFYQTVLGAVGWTVRNQAADFIELVPPGDPEGKDFLLVVGTARDHPKPLSGFNRNNVGLDHVAFSVTAGQVAPLLHVLAALKIPVEDGGITDDDFGGKALFFEDPDGMKMEFHLIE